MSAVDNFLGAFKFLRSLSLFKISQNYPKAYLALVFIAALLGYAYLLLFPVGVIYGGYQTILALMLPFSGDMLLTTLTWISITLFSAGMTHGIVTIKFENPEGIALSNEKAQLVFNTLEEIQQDIKWPKVQNVVLSRRFELNVIKTPLYGLPFWSRNTLIIGYPFMQTISPEYFDCALTRKLGQFAKRKNIFFNWLSFLRDTWLQYPHPFNKRALVGDQLNYWFFRLYGNFYHQFALYITQADELKADEMVLNKLNDRDVFKTAETIRVVQMFLDQHYWPKLNTLLDRKTVSPAQLKPYDHLPKATMQMMQSNIVTHWLKLLSLENKMEGSPEAPFARRMEYMGYNKMYSLKPYDKAAAQYYFGPANTQLAALMNKMWAAQVSKELAHQQKAAHNQAKNNAQQRLTVAF